MISAGRYLDREMRVTKTMPPMSSSPGWPAPIERFKLTGEGLQMRGSHTFESVNAQAVHSKTLRRLSRAP